MFCAQPDCPQQTHPIFGNGQWVGDCQVVRLVYSTNLANYYEATRHDEATRTPCRLLLKVAHHYDQYEDGNAMQPHYFLVAEAYWLMSITQMRPKNHNPDDPNHPLNILPVLVPAYEGATLAGAYYGLTTIGTQVYRYSVLAWIDGIFLTEKLAQNPQPYYTHVAQMMNALMTTLQFLYGLRGDYAHFNLTPDAIFIRASDDASLRPVLFDLGFVKPINMRDDMLYPVIRYFVDPRYTAPAVFNIAKNVMNPRQADLFSLGMLTYTLLMGKPYLGETTLSGSQLRQRALKMNTSDIKIDRTDMAGHGDIFSRVIQIAMLANLTEANKPTQSLDMLKNNLVSFSTLPPIRKEQTLQELTWRWGLLIAILALSITLVAVLFAQLV